jgi:tRNA-specific 2-thiouridylase
MARRLGLPVHDKPDSQEICFVPDDDYLSFVRDRRPGRETRGAIVDEGGNVLGEHSGIEAFTIGQRRGLGIAFGEPRYVVEIEPLSRTVTVGRRKSLDKPGLIASRFNWQGPEPDGPISCLAQIRAQHRAVPATVEARPGGEARILFETPQPAITPGQVVTVYQDDLVLGGGWIIGSLPLPADGAR